MAHVISHTTALNCEAHDAWECLKHSDKILPDLLPEYFAKAEILEGTGGPGTIRVLHFGPGNYFNLNLEALALELAAQLWLHPKFMSSMHRHYQSSIYPKTTPRCKYFV